MIVQIDGVSADTLKGIESFIRDYTHNNFTVREMTYNTPIEDGKLVSVLPTLKVGDTVQISQSKYNNGVYVIEDLSGILDLVLYDEPMVKVTLVRYPESVKEGVRKLVEYSTKMADKVGIASESISRHSVSYQAQGTDSIGGYPSYLMAFLKPYMKARF